MGKNEGKTGSESKRKCTNPKSKSVCQLRARVHTPRAFLASRCTCSHSLSQWQVRLLGRGAAPQHMGGANLVPRYHGAGTHGQLVVALLFAALSSGDVMRLACMLPNYVQQTVPLTLLDPAAAVTTAAAVAAAHPARSSGAFPVPSKPRTCGTGHPMSFGGPRELCWGIIRTTATFQKIVQGRRGGGRAGRRREHVGQRRYECGEGLCTAATEGKTRNEQRRHFRKN